MTTIQTQRSTVRMLLVGIVELVLTLIGAVPAGIPHREHSAGGANRPQTHGKPRAKAAESCGGLGKPDRNRRSEVRNEGRRGAKPAFGGSESGSFPGGGTWWVRGSRKNTHCASKNGGMACTLGIYAEAA